MTPLDALLAALHHPPALTDDEWPAYLAHLVGQLEDSPSERSAVSGQRSAKTESKKKKRSAKRKPAVS